MSAGDKPGENVLLQSRNRTGIEPQLPAVPLQQPGRQHQKAQTHGGGDRLGEGVQVDDPPAEINALQGRNRAAGEAEFAVVIIFDDGAFRILRPAQQRLPAG